MIQSNSSIATQATLTVRILTKRIRMKRGPPRASRRALWAQRLAPQNARPVRPTLRPVGPASAHALRAAPVSEPRTWDPPRNRGAPSHPERLLPRRSTGPPRSACHAHCSILRPHPPRPVPPHAPHAQPRHALSVSHPDLRPSRPAPTSAHHHARTRCLTGPTLNNAHLYSPQSARRAARAAPRPVRLGAPRGQRSPPRPNSGAPRPRRAPPASPRPARRPLLCGIRQRAQRQPRRGPGPTRPTWPRQSHAPPHVVPSTRSTLPRHAPRRALHLSRTDALHGHPTLPTAYCPRDARRPARHDTIVFFRAIL